MLSLKGVPKPKGVTTQMKALDEYILMVLFVLLLKRVHFLVNVIYSITKKILIPSRHVS